MKIYVSLVFFTIEICFGASNNFKGIVGIYWDKKLNDGESNE